ncbi:MAG: hypothetical protein C4560_06025 [Nitrospiraceae bacterium]|nr:MAG: hypothetical protein C4560_06025 [Nitrospiraceae bacterium]
MKIDTLNITFAPKNHGVRSSAPETVKNSDEQAVDEQGQTSDHTDKVSITQKARDYMLAQYDIADSEALQHGFDKARKLGLIKNLIQESTGEKIKLKDIFDQVRNMEPVSEIPAEDVPEDTVGDVAADVPADVVENAVKEETVAGPGV